MGGCFLRKQSAGFDANRSRGLPQLRFYAAQLGDLFDRSDHPDYMAFRIDIRRTAQGDVSRQSPGVKNCKILIP